MQSGILTEVIYLYRQVITRNDYLEEVEKFEEYYKTRAQVINQTGRRTIENSEITYDYTKIFKIRHYVKVDDTIQIKYKNKMYRVLSIDDDRIRHNKIIVAEEIQE